MANAVARGMIVLPIARGRLFRPRSNPFRFLSPVAEIGSCNWVFVSGIAMRAGGAVGCVAVARAQSSSAATAPREVGVDDVAPQSLVPVLHSMITAPAGSFRQRIESPIRVGTAITRA